MTKNLKSIATLCAAVLLMAGCSSTPPLPPVDVTWLSLQAARTAQEGMVEAPRYDKNRIYAAKIRVANQFYSITTNAPVILSSTGMGDEKSITAMRFSRDQNEILIFTRNPRNGEGYRVNIPLDEANYWPEFNFPIIRGNRVQTMPVQIISVIRKPDLPDSVRGMREYLQRELPPEEPRFTELPDPGPKIRSNDY